MLGINVLIPYGSNYLSLELSNATVILPRREVIPKDELGIIKNSLENPIGAPKLRELVDPHHRVCLLVSDITRPLPSYKVVPLIINELVKSGVKNDNISIVFATGIHRPHTRDEWIKLLGVDIVKGFKVFDHNCWSNFVEYLGKTSRGTPVLINSTVVNADLRIGVANIDPHYFAGYSGGGKSVLPGVAAYDSIKENHRMMLLPGAELAKLDGNPVREDIEEAASILGLEYIVNVVLNERKEIVGSVAGHFIKAHREGVRIFNKIYGVEVGRKYDVVIASPGGYPKDINLYQAHKALEVAYRCVNKGGVIVLVAECDEGVGDSKTEELLYSGMGPEEIINFVKGNFDLGYHKVYAISRIAVNAEVVVVSHNIRESKIFKVFKNLGDAMKYVNQVVRGGDVLVLPYASSIIPKDLI